MQTANILIVLTFFASLACAELDISTIESNGSADPPRTDGQLKLRSDELQVEGMSNSRESVDPNQAIQAAAAKEVQHKSRTPEERIFEGGKGITPLTSEISSSDRRERRLKESGVKTAERLASELQAAAEKEKARLVELGAKETKSKEQAARDKELSEKAAAKALTETNEAKSKKDVADEKEQKIAMAAATEKGEKQAAKIRDEQEKLAQSREKLEKVQSAQSKLVNDKKDAEQALIDGPKQINAAQLKISKAREVLAQLHSTSPEGIAEKVKEQEIKAQEKAAKDSQAKADAIESEKAAKKQAAENKELSEKTAEKGVKLATQAEANAAAAIAAKKEAQKAEVAAEEAAVDQAMAADAKEKAQKDDVLAKEAAAAFNKRKAAEAELAKQEQLQHAAGLTAKAAAEMAEAAAGQAAAAEASKIAMNQAAVLKQQQEVQQQEEAAARANQAAEQRAEDQAAKDFAAAAERKAKDEQSITEKKEKDDAKQEAQAESKLKNAHNEEEAIVAMGKMDAEKAAMKALEAQETAREEARHSFNARQGEELKAKNEVRQGFKVKEGDAKRQEALEVKTSSEMFTKTQNILKDAVMKQNMAQMTQLKAVIAAQQIAEAERKVETEAKTGRLSSAINKEKAFKIKEQQTAEKAYMTTMNNPVLLLQHLKKLTAKWVGKVVLESNQQTSDDAQKLVIDKLVLDLRAAAEPGEAEELEAQIGVAFREEKHKMLTEIRTQSQAIKLKLEGSAVVDQLENLERTHPNSQPLITEGISEFSKARQLVDKLTVSFAASRKESKISGRNKLVALEKNEKEKIAPSEQYSFDQCECTTHLTKLVVIYKGTDHAQTKIMNDKNTTYFDKVAVFDETVKIEPLEAAAGNLTFSSPGVNSTTMNFNCQYPVFIGMVVGDWKIFEASSDKGLLCDRPSPRQITNQKILDAPNKTATGGPRLHQHFNTMMAWLTQLSQNWDYKPAVAVNPDANAVHLSPEQVAEKQAKLGLEADKAAAIMREEESMRSTPHRPATKVEPPPPKDAQTLALQADAKRLASEAISSGPPRGLEVELLDF